MAFKEDSLVLLYHFKCEKKSYLVWMEDERLWMEDEQTLYDGRLWMEDERLYLRIS